MNNKNIPKNPTWEEYIEGCNYGATHRDRSRMSELTSQIDYLYRIKTMPMLSPYVNKTFSILQAYVYSGVKFSVLYHEANLRCPYTNLPIKENWNIWGLQGWETDREKLEQMIPEERRD